MIKAIKILEIYEAEELASYKKAGSGNPHWHSQTKMSKLFYNGSVLVAGGGKDATNE